MIRTFQEQEQLAKESVDLGYGYVCMLCTKGLDWTWYVAEVFEFPNKADDWWMAQEKGARVYRVRGGVVTLFSAK